MGRHSKIDLEPLREIGWAKWDPIDLGGPEHGWPADEYDAYLLDAAGQIANGRSVEEVADYLVKIETENMELENVPGVRERALEVAAASVNTSSRYPSERPQGVELGPLRCVSAMAGKAAIRYGSSPASPTRSLATEGA